MDTIQVPPEIEAVARVIAAESHRPVQDVYEEILRDGLKAAFDQQLQIAHDEILAGKFVTEEESLAGLEKE